jgi:hypothetical protein
MGTDRKDDYLEERTMSDCGALQRVISVAAFICVLAVGLIHSQAAPSSETIPAEEYEVYAVALDHMVGGTSYVIIDTTSTHDKPENLGHALRFPIEYEKLVTGELVRDFKEKNTHRYAIAQQFPKELAVTLLSEREEHEIFSDPDKDGWNAFYKKHPFSSGITRISRVGFNMNHDVAAVYVGNTRNWEAGHGAYLLLQKVEGKWKVVAQSRGWIS